MKGDIKTAVLPSVERLLHCAVEEGVFAAAQGAWCRPDEEPTVVCAGDIDPQRVAPTTLFDIASLTKLFAASACLRLVSRGKIRLDATVEEYVKATINPSVATATLAELLAHEAGFPAYLPLFEKIPERERGTYAARKRIIEMAMALPPSGRPSGHAEYSDLGFMALTHIIENVAEMPLDQVIQVEVCHPLGLQTVHFRPIGTENRPANEMIAPTERCPWRGRVLRGEVHDDNAWVMGGVSGHAGLFATASDLAAFGAAWLQCIRRDGWLPADLACEAVRRRPSGRGLGWDLRSPKGSSAGDRMSPNSFGHLGFTGCSLWVDPERLLCVALLTNRVRFGRDNQTIREFRPRFHDGLLDAIIPTRRGF